MKEIHFQVLVQGTVTAEDEKHAQKIVSNGVSLNLSLKNTVVQIAFKKPECNDEDVPEAGETGGPEG